MPTLSIRFLWFLLFLLTTLSTAAIGFFTNILTADASKLWNPENRWLWLVLAGLILMTTVLGYLAAQPSDRAASQPAAPDLSLRKRFMEALQGELSRRLEILHYDVVIDIGLAAQPESVSREPRWQLLSEVAGQDAIQPTYTVSTHPETQSIDTLWNLFEEEGKRLLILGSPGAGKTITLLKLAETLLEQARFQRDAPIPVIFELSAWNGSALNEWLAQQLHVNYSMALKTAKGWIEAGLVLPLMDGLDELVMAQQVKCVQAINQFLHQQLGQPAVVCCRVLEYQVQAEDHQVKLDQLHAAVCLQALSDGQIHQYLQQMQCPSLWTEIQQQPELRYLLEPEADDTPGLLRTPLFLTMLVIAYQGQPIRNQQELLQAYLEQRLNPDVIAAERKRIRRQWAYAPGKEPNWRQTSHYLHWLAATLKQEGNATPDFLIEGLQPTLLKTPGQRRQYWLIAGLIVLLTGVLVAGVVAVNIDSGLVSWLSISIAGGTTGGLIAWLVEGMRTIELVETFKALPSRLAQNRILKFLILILIGVLIGELITTLTVALIGGKINGVIDGRFFWKLIFFLVLGLIGGLTIELRVDLKTQDSPNQGIQQSAKNMVLVTGLTYPLWVVCFWVLDLVTGVGSIKAALLAGFVIAFLLGFSLGGGFAVIRHVTLRLVLHRQGVMPWNYAQFLNYCAERRLLQRIGGRYRFIHRLLMEHFAETNLI